MAAANNKRANASRDAQNVARKQHVGPMLRYLRTASVQSSSNDESSLSSLSPIDYFAFLPDEIYLRIALVLPLRAKLALARTSARWARVVSDCKCVSTRFAGELLRCETPDRREVQWDNLLQTIDCTRDRLTLWRVMWRGGRLEPIDAAALMRIGSPFRHTTRQPRADNDDADVTTKIYTPSVALQANVNVVLDDRLGVVSQARLADLEHLELLGALVPAVSELQQQPHMSVRGMRLQLCMTAHLGTVTAARASGNLLPSAALRAHLTALAALPVAQCTLASYLRSLVRVADRTRTLAGVDERINLVTLCLLCDAVGPLGLIIDTVARTQAAYSLAGLWQDCLIPNAQCYDVRVLHALVAHSATQVAAMRDRSLIIESPVVQYAVLKTLGFRLNFARFSEMHCTTNDTAVLVGYHFGDAERVGYWHTRRTICRLLRRTHLLAAFHLSVTESPVSLTQP